MVKRKKEHYKNIIAEDKVKAFMSTNIDKTHTCRHIHKNNKNNLVEK